MPSGQARIEVIFMIDADGVLTVEAVEKTMDIRQEVMLNPSYGLDEEMILNLLQNKA